MNAPRSQLEPHLDKRLIVLPARPEPPRIAAIFDETKPLIQRDGPFVLRDDAQLDLRIRSNDSGTEITTSVIFVFKNGSFCLSGESSCPT